MKLTDIYQERLNAASDVRQSLTELRYMLENVIKNKDNFDKVNYCLEVLQELESEIKRL